MPDVFPRTSRHRAAAILLIGTVLYLLSFGPACWLGAKNHKVVNAYNFVYAPIIWVGCYGPAPMRDLILRFANFGIRPGSVLIWNNQLMYLPLPVFL